MSQYQDFDEQNEWRRWWRSAETSRSKPAVSVAGALGAGAERPAILADSNNAIVWLAPAPIVAKVTSQFRHAELESLARGSRSRRSQGP